MWCRREMMRSHSMKSLAMDRSRDEWNCYWNESWWVSARLPWCPRNTIDCLAQPNPTGRTPKESSCLEMKHCSGNTGSRNGFDHDHRPRWRTKMICQRWMNNRSWHWCRDRRRLHWSTRCVHSHGTELEGRRPPTPVRIAWLNHLRHLWLNIFRPVTNRPTMKTNISLSLSASLQIVLVQHQSLSFSNTRTGQVQKERKKRSEFLFCRSIESILFPSGSHHSRTSDSIRISVALDHFDGYTYA